MPKDAREWAISFLGPALRNLDSVKDETKKMADADLSKTELLDEATDLFDRAKSLMRKLRNAK